MKMNFIFNYKHIPAGRAQFLPVPFHDAAASTRTPSKSVILSGRPAAAG
jgi:hypothetical protein